eukprot:12878039-Ditylum_brightwellii.AAC.1
MATRAATQSNIQIGFTSNGIIDNEFKRNPDFNKMLATCRRNPTKEEYEKCINSFPYLFSEFESRGHADDNFFENLSLKVDVDINGTLAQRDATISQES